MLDTNTIDLKDREYIPGLGTFGFNSEFDFRQTFAEYKANFYPVLRNGIRLISVYPQVTVLIDNWVIERRQRDDTVTKTIYQESIGKPISRIEALRLARQILKQAEEERIEIAEVEAARGIQWSDDNDL